MRRSLRAQPLCSYLTEIQGAESEMRIILPTVAPFACPCLRIVQLPSKMSLWSAFLAPFHEFISAPQSVLAAKAFDGVEELGRIDPK